MNCILEKGRIMYASEAGLGKFFTKNLVVDGSRADRTSLYIGNPCMFVMGCLRDRKQLETQPDTEVAVMVHIVKR